jgi:hypothetical protein
MRPPGASSTRPSWLQGIAYHVIAPILSPITTGKVFPVSRRLIAAFYATAPVRPTSSEHSNNDIGLAEHRSVAVAGDRARAPRDCGVTPGNFIVQYSFSYW